MSLSPPRGEQSSSLPAPPAFLDDVEVPSLTSATSAVVGDAVAASAQSSSVVESGYEMVEPPSIPASSALSATSASLTSNNDFMAPNSSFTADSPYFSFYVDQEVRSLQVLTDTLRDIAARAATFGKCGALMAEATRRLAMSCKLKGTNNPATNPAMTEEEIEQFQKQQLSLEDERQKAVGEEMGAVLKVLGDALEEIADAQLQMCESLQASLSTSLNHFCNTELAQVQGLKADAESMTETAEQSFGKYLHGRHAASENETVSPDQDLVSSSWNKISEQVGHQWMRWSSSSGEPSGNERSGVVAGGFKNWSRSSSGGGAGGDATSFHPVIPRGGRRKKQQQLHRDQSPSADDAATATSWAMASSAANLRLTLEQIRLAQATAEMNRFQLLQKLVSIQHRRNFELGESVLAGLHGIRAYFHHCSDLVMGLVPRMNRIQSSQAESRKCHESILEPWNDRERGITSTVSFLVDSASQASALVSAIAQVQQPTPDMPPPPAAILDQILLLQQQTMSLKEIEQLSQIWELPMLLAESSSYHREPTPGVIAEGWLYKKATSRVTLNPWNRRWFMMNNEGLYYFRTNSDRSSKKQQQQQQLQPIPGEVGAYWNSLERVKVCDVILCTVREVRNDGLPRFCFEVFTPNQKPILVQARGPHEYNMWVRGIRSTAEEQLVHGNHSASTTSLYQQDTKKGNNNNKGKQDNNASETGFDFVSRPARPPVALSDNDTDDDRQSKNLGGNDRYQDDDDDDEDADHAASAMAERDLLGRRQQVHGKGNPAVELILKANSVCADCGMACPDWASLNLGVLVCIECSGVHRSLGVHVSKVRSLMLDSLTDSEGRLLLALGNANANKIWEESVGSQKGWTKPNSSQSRKIKEEWIKSKYSWKGFLKYCDSDGKTMTEREDKFSKDLFIAAKRADVLAVAYALAHGGNVEWKNPEEGGKTALHICALSKINESTLEDDWKGIECAELLIQNGAKLDTLDHKTQTVLDCALTENACHEMIEFLSLRSA